MSSPASADDADVPSAGTHGADASNDAPADHANGIGAVHTNRQASPDVAGYIAASEARKANCCMDDAWRGKACMYHLGMRDGIDLILDQMEMNGE